MYAFITSAIMGVWIADLYFNLIVFEYSGLSSENSLLYTRRRNPWMHLKYFKASPFNFDVNAPTLIGKLNLNAKNGSKSAWSTPG